MENVEAILTNSKNRHAPYSTLMLTILKLMHLKHLTKRVFEGTMTKKKGSLVHILNFCKEAFM
jgi:hypothetical protein